MYNLYIFEKNTSDQEKKKLEEEKNEKLKKKRKKEIDKLILNYDKRMNNFIISLCHHPIYLKDLTNKSNSQLIIDEEKSAQKKILMKKKYKNFSFGGFITDKKRIELLNEEKEINKNYEQKILINKLKQEAKNEKKRKKDKIILQPRMRFKPRNELERIADVMNLLGENKNKKKIKNLLDQLKKIDIDKFRKTKDFTKLKQLYKKNPLYLEENKKDKSKDNNKNNESKSKSSSSDDDDDDELDYKLETNLHRKIRNINLQLNKEKKKKNKLLKDRGGNNNESSLDRKIKEKNKKLLELFKDDEKLYFKGASQYVQNKNQNYSSNKNTIIRSMSAMNFPNTINNLYSPKSYNSNINFNSFNSSSPRDKPNNITFFQKINTIYSDRKTRPVSMLISLNKKRRNQTINNFGRNDLIKKVDIKYQIKKKNMDKIFNKEINNSILSDFYEKLSQKEYSQVFEKPLYLENNIDKINIGKINLDMDLDEKLNYLKKITEFKFNKNDRRFWSIINSKNEENNNDFRKSICIPKGNKDKNKVKHNDDEVIIDGIKYKNYDIKNISDIIFTKCGYYHKKII